MIVFGGITRFASRKSGQAVIPGGMKASFQQAQPQIKTPADTGVGLRVCGEGGIRTPGTVIGTPV